MNNIIKNNTSPNSPLGSRAQGGSGVQDGSKRARVCIGSTTVRPVNSQRIGWGGEDE